jgi:membrane protein implicated in regulation of membrane protease activity
MGLTIATFALGVGHFGTIGGHHGHVGLGHGAGGHGAHIDHGHSLDESISPLNMSTILAFVTWFSGSGYVLTSTFGLATLLASVMASGVGLVGAGIVFFVLVRVLLPGQTPYLNPEDYLLEGTIGRLTVPIQSGGTGELVFSKGGARRVASARSADGDPIERGTEVVVVREERGIVYVEPFSEYLDGSAGPRTVDV